MDSNSIIIEQEYNASIDTVWKAITDKGDMEQWYFSIDEFIPKTGFEFRFYAGSEEQKYLHICKILDIVPKAKLSYSWKYDDVDGYSVVTYELSAYGNKTRLKLIHEGIKSFPQDKPDFSSESFKAGWNDIINISLKEFVENN